MQLLYTKVYKRKGTCNTFCIHDEINMVPCAKRWRSNMATCHLYKNEAGHNRGTVRDHDRHKGVCST